MPDDLNLRLRDAKERMFRLHKAERRREELLNRVNEQERLILRLELQLESEQADVDKLTRLSLVNLFHTILRSKAEQLDMERQQVLASALQLDAAKKALLDTKNALIQVGDDLAKFQLAEVEYEKLMALKEDALLHVPASSHELASMNESIADQKLLVKELQEALTAGRLVLASLTDASNSLDKAENWGKWDLWGGGMLSTHAKHSHVDDAKTFIQQANHQILNFQSELKDLHHSFQIEIDISSTLKMADYWFDGLIADWIVQGRINNSQNQTLSALNHIRPVVNRLQTEHTAAEAALSGMLTKRINWIEESRIDN
ncbi:hypothetical protein A8709_16490 [Paenibacillus pectinilyticus]|uniref:Uncharacterized protein n=1 Tax=Paenibacillus pectinilyticus TaxID=512399 RepID=A0A1C1A535_9BACL|nr:hypothetical protein [Paenibacillus pectinilyticus]OCT15658.1 hypothetical protein A8709_16490 [Paenibacillus pectinilyticus]